MIIDKNVRYTWKLIGDEGEMFSILAEDINTAKYLLWEEIKNKFPNKKDVHEWVLDYYLSFD